MESPVQYSPRLCVQDTVVGGVTIPAGAMVLLVWGSGNRDEQTFECPAQFDLDRPGIVRDQMAFGHGIHFCIGAPLGRLEGRVAFEQLLTRLKNIRLAPSQTEFENYDSILMRGPLEVRLTFERA